MNEDEVLKLIGQQAVEITELREAVQILGRRTAEAEAARDVALVAQEIRAQASDPSAPTTRRASKSRAS